MVTRNFPLAGTFAGKPTLFGNYLLIPLSTGTVFRINVKELQTLEEGPSWRNDRLTPEATCKLAALSDEEFLATDGNKTLLRFKWSGANAFESKAKIPWVEKIEYAISTARQGDRTYFSFADAKGAVTIWNAAFTVKPLRVCAARRPVPSRPERSPWGRRCTREQNSALGSRSSRGRSSGSIPKRTLRYGYRPNQWISPVTA